MSDFEVRSVTGLEATEEGKLVGYAARYNSRSHDLGGFVEVIAPGCFDRTLKENGDNVLALVEHDTNKVLATTKNGTLKIESDERGLRVEIDPAPTTYAKDLVTLVRRGDVAGMSFRFKPYPGGAKMDLSQNPPVRTLESVRLAEVSVTVIPAYPDTSVSVRALEDEAYYAEDYRMALQKMRLRLAEID